MQKYIYTKKTKPVMFFPAPDYFKLIPLLLVMLVIKDFQDKNISILSRDYLISISEST